MSKKHFMQTVAAIALSFLYPGLASAKTYSLMVAGERLEFAPQPDKGYVVKPVENAGGVHALTGAFALDGEVSRPVGALDRRRVWIVKNEGPAGRNEEMIRTLRACRRVIYAAPLFSSHGDTVAIIPEIVVRVEPWIEAEEMQRLSETAGCTIRKRMEFTRQEYLLDVLGPDADAVFMAVVMLGRYREVEWACPNTAFRPMLAGKPISVRSISDERIWMATAEESVAASAIFPNDEYFPEQWHLHNTGQVCLYGSGGTPDADINAPEAWEITTGDPNIVVAVIDSGVDTNHPDLIHNLVPGHDFWENDDSPDPALDHSLNAHGTACAGLIAAQGNNGIGVSGVTWNCKIMPIRHSRHESADNQYFITESEEATAIRWAANHGADVLSSQWGFYSPKPIVHSAIVDITEIGGMGRDGKGCVACFSVGNSHSSLHWPARYPEVIAVGGTDHHDGHWHYSNHGPELDIVAPCGGLELVDLPGGFQCTTDISGPYGVNNKGMPDVYGPIVDVDMDYRYFGGTSAACPVAAGVTALILSVEPNLTNEEVRHFLYRSAKDLGDPGRDDYYGWGRVDARAALDMVLAKRADLNDDWVVDEEDEALLIQAIDANDLAGDIAPAAKRDGVVDADDLALLTQYLGTEIPELGLIAHWKLDETEGTIAFDSEGDHDATAMGVPLWQPEGGVIGGALQFSGMPNFATAETVRDPSGGPLSVFAWVKGGAAGQVVVSQQTGANWLMADPATGALMTELKSGGRQSRALSSDAVITEGDWHRIGFTWDGANRRLYVDDILVAEDTDTGLAQSNGNLLLGCGATMTPATFFTGLIDDVRVYDRAVRP